MRLGQRNTRPKKGSREVEMQLPSYERSNKTIKFQKFLIERANCQGTVTFSVCSHAPKVFALKPHFRLMSVVIMLSDN